MSNSKKLTSKTIKTDKEEDFILLREQNTKLMNEKKYLSSEVLRLQKEIEQKDKIIRDITLSDDKNPEVIEKGKENYLIGNLKRQIKELQTLKKIKEEEVELLKRNIKVTKIAELTEEVRTYQSELAKIKNSFTDLIEKDSLNKKKIKESEEMIKGLKYKILLEEDKTIKLTKELNEKSQIIDSQDLS